VIFGAAMAVRIRLPGVAWTLRLGFVPRFGRWRGRSFKNLFKKATKDYFFKLNYSELWLQGFDGYGSVEKTLWAKLDSAGGFN
jgi:hypothetical protein